MSAMDDQHVVRDLVFSRGWRRGSGGVCQVENCKRADRPQLATALASCRTRRAVPLITKLERLGRDECRAVALRCKIAFHPIPFGL